MVLVCGCITFHPRASVPKWDGQSDLGRLPAAGGLFCGFRAIPQWKREGPNAAAFVGAQVARIIFLEDEGTCADQTNARCRERDGHQENLWFSTFCTFRRGPRCTSETAKPPALGDTDGFAVSSADSQVTELITHEWDLAFFWSRRFQAVCPPQSRIKFNFAESRRSSVPWGPARAFPRRS